MKTLWTHQQACDLWSADTCLVTLSLTVNETLKWLSLLPILMQKSFWWWQCSDRYIISFSLPLSRVPNKPYGFCGRKALCLLTYYSFPLPPSSPVPNKPYGFCGRKATCLLTATCLITYLPLPPSSLVPNKPYGFCGRKATCLLVRSELNRVVIQYLLEHNYI